MSWSVSAIGKPKAIAAALESYFAASVACAEPEESVRQAARQLIGLSLAAERDDSAIQVNASGSMSSTYNPETKAWGQPSTNTLKIDIQPIYGFVE